MLVHLQPGLGIPGGHVGQLLHRARSAGVGRQVQLGAQFDLAAHPPLRVARQPVAEHRCGRGGQPPPVIVFGIAQVELFGLVGVDPQLHAAVVVGHAVVLDVADGAHRYVDGDALADQPDHLIGFGQQGDQLLSLRTVGVVAGQVDHGVLEFWHPQVQGQAGAAGRAERHRGRGLLPGRLSWPAPGGGSPAPASPQSCRLHWSTELPPV